MTPGGLRGGDRRSTMTLATSIVIFSVVVASCSSPGDPFEATARLSGTTCNRDVAASAVVIGDELMITNAHNVAGSTDPFLVEFEDGASLTATVVGFDRHRDLALLAVPGLDRPTLPASDPLEGEAGTIVRRLGLEQESVRYEDADPITIAGHDIYDEESTVQRDGVRVRADVAPGYSGAPILNEKGEMIGLVYAESRSTGWVYAVTATEINQFIAATDTSTLADTRDCTR